jgi:hypothetical protein
MLLHDICPDVVDWLDGLEAEGYLYELGPFWVDLIVPVAKLPFSSDTLQPMGLLLTDSISIRRPPSPHI